MSDLDILLTKNGPSNLVCIEGLNPLLPTSPVHRSPAAYQYGRERVAV